MKKFVRTVFISFTIWIAAALINSIMVTAWSLFSGHGSGQPLLTFAMVTALSLLFSIPGIFIFWIFFIANYYEAGLFQLLLKTGLFTSLFSTLLFFGCAGKGLSGAYWFALFAVTAAIAAILIHHSTITNNVITNKNKTNV